jgi:AMMECR1 domain-containing protein
VEPDAQWQPSGVPLQAGASWHSEPAVGAAAARALDMLRALAEGSEEIEPPLPDDLFPGALHSLYVTVYLNGRMRGCAGSAIAETDRDIRRLVEAAFRDSRFEQPGGQPERMAVTVSLLFNRLALGEMSAEEVAPRFRLGKQALAVQQNQRYGMMLPFVAVTSSLNAAGYAAEVIDKAGITRAPYCWIRFDCATWLADHRGVDLIEYGFRQPAALPGFEETLRELTEWQCDYLIRNIRDDGGFYATFEPFQNWIYRGHGVARGTHATWILMKTGRTLNRPDAVESAGKLLDGYLAKIRESSAGLWIEDESEPPSVAELSFILLALAELNATIAAGRLRRASRRRSGRASMPTAASPRIAIPMRGAMNFKTTSPGRRCWPWLPRRWPDSRRKTKPGCGGRFSITATASATSGTSDRFPG